MANPLIRVLVDMTHQAKSISRVFWIMTRGCLSSSRPKEKFEAAWERVSAYQDFKRRRALDVPKDTEPEWGA
jgi:hypothetical protein